VFDGCPIPVEPPLPTERRRLVRVSFSPQDIEADDVLVSIIDDVPLYRPVVVVSNDRRVQTEARRLVPTSSRRHNCSRSWAANPSLGRSRNSCHTPRS